MASIARLQAISNLCQNTHVKRSCSSFELWQSCGGGTLGGDRTATDMSLAAVEPHTTRASRVLASGRSIIAKRGMELELHSALLEMFADDLPL